MGASCANAKVGSDLTERIDGERPRIERKDGSNTWKNGGVELIGLKNVLKVLSRKVASWPRTLEVCGLMN